MSSTIRQSASQKWPVKINALGITETWCPQSDIMRNIIYMWYMRVIRVRNRRRNLYPPFVWGKFVQRRRWSSSTWKIVYHILSRGTHRKSRWNLYVKNKRWIFGGLNPSLVRLKNVFRLVRFPYCIMCHIHAFLNMHSPRAYP